MTANCWLKRRTVWKTTEFRTKYQNSVPHQVKNSDALLLDLREVVKVGTNGWH